jgi:hypothetical protein
MAPYTFPKKIFETFLASVTLFFSRSLRLAIPNAMRIGHDFIFQGAAQAVISAS